MVCLEYGIKYELNNRIQEFDCCRELSEGDCDLYFTVRVISKMFLWGGAVAAAEFC